MSYLALRHLHIGCVVLTFAGFCLRYYWRERSPQSLHQRWVRGAPHVVDTILLSSAIAMAVISEQYPLVHGWLTAQLLGLLTYILCGTMALRRARTIRLQHTFALLAVLSFGFVVGAAITRSAQSWLVFLA